MQLKDITDKKDHMHSSDAKEGLVEVSIKLVFDHNYVPIDIICNAEGRVLICNTTNMSSLEWMKDNVDLQVVNKFL